MNREELQKWFSEQIMAQDAAYRACRDGDKTEAVRRQREDLWSGEWRKRIEAGFQDMQKQLTEKTDGSLISILQDMRMEYLQIDWKIRKDLIRTELEKMDCCSAAAAENCKKLDKIAETYQKSDYPDWMEVRQQLETKRSTIKKQLKQELFPLEKLEVRPETLDRLDVALEVFSADQAMTEMLMECRNKTEAKWKEIEAYQQQVQRQQEELNARREKAEFRACMVHIVVCLNHGQADTAYAAWKTQKTGTFLSPEVYEWNDFFLRAAQLFQNCITDANRTGTFQNEEELIRLKYQYRLNCVERGIRYLEQEQREALDTWERLKALEWSEKQKENSSKGGFKKEDYREYMDLNRWKKAAGQPEELKGMLAGLFRKTQETVQDIAVGWNEEKKELKAFYRSLSYWFEEQTGCFKMKETR